MKQHAASEAELRARALYASRHPCSSLCKRSARAPSDAHTQARTGAPPPERRASCPLNLKPSPSHAQGRRHAGTDRRGGRTSARAPRELPGLHQHGVGRLPAPRPHAHGAPLGARRQRLRLVADVPGRAAAKRAGGHRLGVGHVHRVLRKEAPARSTVASATASWAMRNTTRRPGRCAIPQETAPGGTRHQAAASYGDAQGVSGRTAVLRGTRSLTHATSREQRSAAAGA